MRNGKYFISLLVLIFFSMGVLAMGKEQSYTNKLIKEKSPYLLQHAHNPVDWYPWGNEAFEKAKKEDKPIFLSIGYSTCHWCHVMEEESFSNPEIAKIMNKHFVSIKVDREERPDIDNIYMSAVMAMTGNGGWPLTVFITPDKKPFYGGTYFPPEDRWGKPGLKTVLNSIADSWKNRRGEILRSGESLTQAISQQSLVSGQKTLSLNEGILKQSYDGFLRRFDPRHGGFGNAPKFPMGHSLSFLLRYWKRSGEPKSLEMVEKTLSSMAEGGIYDHIGGGFHRYSTDARWRVPHFEKMLYDQAILAKTYLEAYQATGKEEYAKTAREIFEYVLRDMTHPQGGFYSAEDADSPLSENSEEKREGAFYLWNKNELVSILGKEQADIFSFYFGAEPGGNALSDPQGEFKEKNILYVARAEQEAAKKFNKSVKDIGAIIDDAKKKLFIIRSKRPRPHLDDKVLTDWNCLMISALSFGSRVLNEPQYRRAADESAKFILKNLVREDGRLLHRYREGESAILGNIDDHAFLIYGLQDLYEATFNPEYLKKAKQLTDDMIRLFWDEPNGGFFFTAHDAESLLVRQKEIYDGAIPSGNSVSALDLIRLGRLTMKREFEEKAGFLFKSFSNSILQAPNAYSQMLIALDFALGPSKEIVIAGEPGYQETAAMINSVYKWFIPNKVVALRPPSGKEEKIVELIPFLKEQAPLEGKPTAYICENYVCKFPATSTEKLQSILKE